MSPRAVPKTAKPLQERQIWPELRSGVECPYRWLSARNAEDVLDARAAPPLRAGDQRDGARERDRPPRRHHRRHRPAAKDRPAAAVVDPDHAPGAVVAVPGRRGLEAAPGLLPAAADDRQPARAGGGGGGGRGRPAAGTPATQSVRTGPQAGPRGYDARKKVKGRKRVLLTDTEGLVQGLRVVPASVQDRDTPGLLEPELAASALRKVWADLAFAGERAAAPLERHGVALELVGRKDKTGFAVEPRRWKIEQTFGCL